MIAFELRHGITLPASLKTILVQANGFPPGCTDADGFRFLPIQEYDKGECPLATIPSRTAFVFVDYLQWSWAYVMELGSLRYGSVYLIGTRDGKPQLVSRSMDEFLEYYLADDGCLYPI